ncbi:MAG: TraX family protein [Methylotenera sp.]
MAHNLAEKRPFNLPSLSLSSGAIETIKWLALLAMTLDHTNKILFQTKFAWMYNLGRLAMPLFGFVLAYNLAKPDAYKNHVYRRVVTHTFIIGLAATPFYKAAFHHAGLGALNIMFTLGLSTWIICLIDKSRHSHSADSIIINRALALALFILGSLFVEGQIIAVGYVLAAWTYCKMQKVWALLIWVLGTAGLGLINGNAWAIAVIPIILLISKINFKLPRLKWVFYAYYPLHLAILISIQRCYYVL